MTCILSFVTAKQKHSDRQVFLLTRQDMSAIHTDRVLMGRDLLKVLKVNQNKR